MGNAAIERQLVICLIGVIFFGWMLVTHLGKGRTSDGGGRGGLYADKDENPGLFYIVIFGESIAVLCFFLGACQLACLVISFGRISGHTRQWATS